MSKTIKRTVLIIAAAALLVIPVIQWLRFSYLVLSWPEILPEVSRLFALLGFVFLFYQYVLSSRVRFLESTIGLDRFFVAHRMTGITALILLVLHGLSYTTYELVLGFLSLNVPKLIGIGGLLLVIVVAGAALFWKALGWSYETWKRLHYASYVILPAVFLHSLLLGTTMGASPLMRVYFSVLLGLWVLLVATRVVRRVHVRSNPHTISDVRRESHDVVSLYFDGPVPDFAPGQFMIVNLPRGAGWSEAHPYTISSSPTDDRLRLSAKAIGDFSASVADVKPGDRALIEAPYGAFSYELVPEAPLVFIAGGIGITPFLSQIRHMRAAHPTRRVRLLWGNKTKQDMAFEDEMAAAQQELRDFSLVHVLSNEEWEGETGFITDELVRRYVDDIDSSHFFICGPPVMMSKTIPMLRELGVESGRIHFERFALG